MALLFFLNSAVCYCVGLAHDHHHGGPNPEAPAPDDCDCLAATDVIPADQRVELPALLLLAPGAEPRLGLWTSPRGLPPRDVRPPGEHSPPRHVLHCALLC